MNILIKILEESQGNSLAIIIGSVAAAIATIIGAIGVFLKKIDWKNKNTILESIHKEDMNKLQEVIKEELKVIKDVTSNNRPKAPEKEDEKN